MLKKLFSIWISFLPLLIWYGKFEDPKFLYFIIGSFILSFYCIYQIFFNKKNISLTKADLFYFLWLIILIISSLQGIHPLDSILGGSYRRQGFIFFFSLWLVNVTFRSFSSSEKLFLKKSLSISILFESILVISQFIFGNTYFGKPVGTLGDANAVAGFLAIGSFFVIEIYSKIYLILISFAILSLQSRSGILSFLPNLTFIFKKFTIIFIFITLLLTGVFSANRSDSTVENRFVIWQLGINEIKNRPILGFGAESGEVVYSEAFKKIHLPIVGLIVDRTHNLFLDLLMWSGILGLISFLLFLIFRFKSLITQNQKFAFLSFMIFSMFQPLSVVHWILFFVI